jgi:aminopeptidase N
VPGINLTRDEARERAGLLSVTGYQIHLDLTAGDTTFTSVTQVSFTCSQPGASTFIDLIAPAVHEVVLNGRSLPVAEVVSEGRIALPDLAEQNELRVVADAAYMHTGEGLHRFVDPVDDEVYLYSQFEVADARRVFTCFDQPDLKAPHTFTVTAPDHWQVISVSPTPEPEHVRDGVARWSFAPTPVLATYVTALIAGPYEVVRDELTVRDGRTIPLGVFARRSLAQHVDAQNIVDITRAGFAWFERTFDCDYPFAKYDQLFVPEFNAGAMENAGAVTNTEVYVFRSKVPQAMVERRALTILHELAHMWFGDLVTMRWWDDLWLNESFAEYASTRCQTEATEWATAWTTFSSAEKSWAYRQDQLATTHPIMANIRDLEDVEVNFDGITYAKGASVLKQLVAWVGQDAFDAGLRTYFAAHAWGNTTLADLFGHLEKTSGRDLDAWAQAWLQEAGVTTLRPEITTAPDGTMTAVAIRQEAPAEHPLLRPHRLAVGCYDLVDGQLERTARVELDVAGELTGVAELAGRPQPALLLVNDDDLAYAKIRLDPHSLGTAMSSLSNFSDSLPATLVWGAAWDMTRDGEFGARDFASLVLSNIGSVTDPSVSQTLLRQLSGALDSYVAPEHRDAATASAADRLRTLLDAAAPGSDQQLLMTRFFTLHASTPAQLAVLAGMLDGSAVPTGLAVDTEMRWSLLIALVAGGVLGEEAISAELASDDTANGRLHAATARAALPDSATKAEVWRAVVDQGDLPNAVQSAMIGGFNRVQDRSLLAPFIEPYFASLLGLREKRTSEMASQIVVGLYPSSQPADLVLAATDEWLTGAGAGAEPALRRMVIEGRDAMARSQRAQAVDRQSPSAP